MGLIMLAGGRQFFDQVPHGVLVFICIGAALYSIGVFFYLWDKYKYTYAVRHVFVLAASCMSLCGVVLMTM